MASALAKQLHSIKLQHWLPGKPSVLFDGKQAANVSLREILETAQEGFRELVLLNAAFEPFRVGLFDEATLDVDREHKPRAFNDALDAALARFLRLLSPYFLLPPAFQVFEYLLRRHRVHVYNVEAVVPCIIPYHETEQFVKVVRLLQLSHSHWRFLEGVQKSGTPLSRAALVKQCVRDAGVLDALCAAGRALAALPWGGGDAASPPVLPFFVVVVLELLAALPSISDMMAKRLLPFVLAGFGRSSTLDFQAGGLMLVTELANRAALSAPLLAALVEAMAGACAAGKEARLPRETLMVLLHLAQTQRLEALPPRALAAVARIPDLAVVVSSLAERYESRALLRVLLGGLARSSLKPGEPRGLALLMDLVRTLPGAGVALHVRMLVGEVAAAGVQEGGKEGARTLLQELDVRNPSEVDAAVRELMKSGNDETKAFLTECLTGRLAAVVPGSGASLRSALEDKEVATRRGAVAQLAAQLAETSEPSEAPPPTDAVSAGVLVLRRLSLESDPDTLGELLALPLARACPVPALAHALATLAARAYQSDDQKAIGPARAALKQLVAVVRGAGTSLPVSVAVGVTEKILPLLMTTPRLRKVSASALELAASLADAIPLLADIPAALKAPKLARSKKISKEGGGARRSCGGRRRRSRMREWWRRWRRRWRGRRWRWRRGRRGCGMERGRWMC